MIPAADLILVGGGLANGLIAWRLAERRPELRVLVVEAGPTLGGNHTWSFHDTDLNAAQRAWTAPLVAHRWTGHTVRFPGVTRRLAGGYASITSQHFHQQLALRLGDRMRLNAPAASVKPTSVTLAYGVTLTAGAVVDGRGPDGFAPLRCLWLAAQKFVGLELKLAAPHGLDAPILMDATVEQRGGYRFLYTLPLAPDRLLVEDTLYADDGALDAEAMRAGALAYAASQGWRVAEVVREERGVLPITLGGDIAGFWDAAPGQPRTGLRAGLFHATTGYSLPDAVRLADRLAALPDLSAPALHAAIQAEAMAAWRRQGFFRLLNRMLFLAAGPGERRAVMARFYRLPEPLITRFYAGRPTLADRLRILAGKPPVPLRAALAAMLARPPHLQDAE